MTSELDKRHLEEELRSARDEIFDLKMEAFRKERTLFDAKGIMLVALGILAGISIGANFGQ